jgi:peptidyl-prolyl cis-trans isomerase C
MKKSFLARSAAQLMLCAAIALPLAAQAQNVAIVNGKAVPKTRVDALIKQVQAQAAAQNQQLPPDLEARVRDKVVMDEIFTQEAEKRGLTSSADYKVQMEQARQAVLTKLLTQDFAKKNAVTDADVKGDYDKFKAQSAGTEYRARHILVEKEDEAKALIAQIKGGASFEELAKKNSKDPGSGANGGDLDFAAPGSYVPEFSQAMVKLKKGEMTQEPVKSQFGYHIIRLDDTREAQFPPFDDVKGQLKQRMEQQRIGAFVEEIRAKAKTDYKFSQ